jgi:DNA-binding protein H-NS
LFHKDDRDDFPLYGRRLTMVDLKSMSVEKLRDLKSKVEAAIHSQLIERRRELESELSKLARYDGGRGRGKMGRGGAGGSVAPKYRNPENPSETWAGRGLAPRWLAAAIKAGKKKEDFLIAGASAAAKQPKKAGKMKRAKK